jgi:hypothetical protein
MWRRNVVMCNHSFEKSLTKFTVDTNAKNRVWNIPFLNMWLLSSKINNCKLIILGSLILKCCSLTVCFVNNFTIFTAGTCYILGTDVSGFNSISTDCPKMAQYYVSYTDIPDMLFFKDLKYLNRGAI